MEYRLISSGEIFSAYESPIIINKNKVYQYIKQDEGRSIYYENKKKKW